jgi:hypothetical protein
MDRSSSSILLTETPNGRSIQDKPGHDQNVVERNAMVGRDIEIAVWDARRHRARRDTHRPNPFRVVMRLAVNLAAADLLTYDAVRWP